MNIPTKIRVQAELCRGCEACALVCSLEHEGQSNPALSRLIVAKNMERYTFDILLCAQCEDADCLAACPNGAIRLDDRGVVVIIDDECIRCGACEQACPQHAIFFNKEVDRFIKCDLCPDRIGGPACVEICPTEALVLRLQTLPLDGIK